MYTQNKNMKRLGMIAAISIIAMMFVTHAAAGDEPEVKVWAPDWTINAFDAIIKIEYVDDGIEDLEGHFDLSFDSDVVNVISVTGMEVGEVGTGLDKTKVVSIEWNFEGSDNNKIRVEFSIPDDVGDVSGGQLVKIHFNLVGEKGDSSALDISNGFLSYKDGTVLSAKWIDDTVKIGSFDVVVNAPEYVSDTFEATINIVDVEDLESGGFALSFDPSVVNVTDVKHGKISGTELPVDSWGFQEGGGTIIVNLNVPGLHGLSGSGTLATISFVVIGEDGDSSILDISEDSNTGLSNTESDLLPINWIDATVTIDSAAPPPPNETDTYVYVKNLDDDKLTVFLFIDDDFIIDKDVSSGSTKKYSNYKLLEGLHTFKIGWYDLDTEQWHEKTKEYSVSGETDLVVITTEEHADEDTKILAHVYVKNLDDDDVTVYLYIDDKYKKYELVEFDDTCEFETDGYEFDEEGVRSFKIKWRDPDTEEEYEKLTRKYIKSEESITMYVDPHTEDDLITTASIRTSSSVPKSSSSTSSPAPATSTGSGTSESSSTTTPTIPITVLHTDPLSTGSNGAGRSQSQYHHLYTLVGAIAIIVAATQIRRT